MTSPARFVSHHLLILVSLFFATGIVLSAFVTLHLPLLIFSLILPTATTLIARWFHRETASRVSLLCLFFLLGVLHGTVSSRAPTDPTHIYNQIATEKEVVLIGYLHDLPRFNGEQSRITVQLKSIRFNDNSTPLQSSGLVQLRLRSCWPETIHPGDLVAIRARLARPHGFNNPGIFYYPHYLATNGVWITGKIRSPLHIARINEPPTLLHSIRSLPQRIRSRIDTAIDLSVDRKYSALYKAVLIGNRAGITKDQLEMFKTTGCMHILAISGLHMGIIATLLFVLFYWLLRRSTWLMLHIPVKKVASLLCLLPLLLYTLIAGANTPVLRSFLMSTIIIGALCVDRRRSTLTILALAALLILSSRPQSLFSASFQLSFAAVVGIILIIPLVNQLLSQPPTPSPQKNLIKKINNWTLASLLVSLSATVTTLPFLLYHFNRFSLVGPVANLLAEPLICLWSLSLGFLAIPMIFMAPPLAALLLKCGSMGFWATLKILQPIGTLPFASLYLPTPSPLLLLLYSGSLVLLFLSQHRRLKQAALLVLAITLGLFFEPPGNLSAPSNQSVLSFLDVGHGSSTLLQLPGGKNVLIDGGAMSSTRYDIGEHVIGPFLWKRGIKHLDAVIITHQDSDHTNGLAFVVKQFHPERIWTNSLGNHNRGYRNLLLLARKNGIPMQIPREGQVLLQTKTAQLICMAHFKGPHRSSNDRGLILRYQHDRFSCLFPGDISSSVEQALVERKESLASTLLLSPHHGSATSNSKIFLTAVQPELVIISNDIRQSRRTKTHDLLDRCRQLGISVKMTSLGGAIIVTSNSREEWYQTSVKSEGGLRRYLTKRAFSTQLE